ncbi:MAG: hypothetical protein Q8R08_02440 [bacterium]|nr:hypothetical protein [bacterium]
MLNRRDPHRCVAELTSQVECHPMTTGTATPQSIVFQLAKYHSASPNKVMGPHQMRFIRR